MSDATRESLAEQAAAYALGALSPDETRAFEAALARSPELAREVAEYRELCGVLASAEPQAPPAALKERLLERVREGKAARLDGAGDAGGGREATPITGRTAKPGRFAEIALGMSLAAALLIAVGLWRRAERLDGAVRQRDSLLVEQSTRLAQREAELNAILQPGVELVTLTATGEAPPVVRVFWDRARNSILMHALRLKPAGAGRAYQLWLLPKVGNPIASSVFNTEADGRGLVIGIPVPADQSIAGFAVTEEPAGGSPQPTTTPFLIGNASPAAQ